MISSVLGFGALARGTAPFWRKLNAHHSSASYENGFLAVIKSYEMTGRHTYFAMAVTAAYALVLLLSLASLYKKLAPRDHGNVLNATSKFNPDLVNQEDPSGTPQSLLCMYNPFMRSHFNFSEFADVAGIQEDTGKQGLPP